MTGKTNKIIAILMTLLLAFAHMSLAALAAGNAIAIESNGYTAEKISNSERGSGEIDGFIEGGDRMNSYAWSMGETEDYVFIGTNRNILLASAMYGGEAFTQLSDILDVYTQGEFPPMDFSDRAARLFMLDKKTNEIKLAYVSPFENGQPLDTAYRSANATFIPQGSETESYFFGSTGPLYTRILRIDADFNPDNGDVPTEVLRFSGKATIRAMTVYDNMLTFAVALPGQGPVIYMSAKPENEASFTKVASVDDFDAFTGTEDLLANGFISDVLEYNGCLYVSFSNSQSSQNASGFMLYKGKYVGHGEPGANQAGWLWEGIVANSSSKYDKGLGDNIAVMGTLCKYTAQDGQEYVYVGTASDPFTAIFPALSGDFSSLYNVVTHPIKLYRFDAQDNWELVLGTPSEEKYFNNKIGNLYAGFDTQEEKTGSCEQYAWALEEHDGKLFIGTFDAATLFKYVTIGIDNEKINGFFDKSEEEKEQAVNSIIKIADTLLVKNGKAGLTEFQASTIRASLLSAIKALKHINVAGAFDSVQNIASAAIKSFNKAINFIDGLIGEKAAQKIIEDSAFGNAYKFACLAQIVIDDERGSGLYVTADGVNFDKINGNGFNDEYNWGIRNLVSTENGLYVGMANPFYGGQLWLVNGDIEASQDEQNFFISLFNKIFNYIMSIINSVFGKL